MENGDIIKDQDKKARFKSLVIDNTKYKTHLTKKFENKPPYSPRNPSCMHAFIPGTIQKIMVKEGQKVSMGMRLLILEAMKMKNRILAPHAGHVKKIYVSEGQNVSKNEMLIEIE
ncbi:MAG: acetyl-CoA carboxylase biotin carboxyl carrier protein subunit [Bacteroidales bacterium]|nr:acetyl-CoA carboxylase biotin carboxyl carrier protein subunit [Bacteroidales bacterium]MCF8456961.1 acetyl-CoA carboxylase biotin carboxyl carrier protein subunit [Bacteroidales bacterium]